MGQLDIGCQPAVGLRMVFAACVFQRCLSPDGLVVLAKSDGWLQGA